MHTFSLYRQAMAHPATGPRRSPSNDASSSAMSSSRRCQKKRGSPLNSSTNGSLLVLFITPFILLVHLSTTINAFVVPSQGAGVRRSLPSSAEAPVLSSPRPPTLPPRSPDPERNSPSSSPLLYEALRRQAPCPHPSCRPASQECTWTSSKCRVVAGLVLFRRLLSSLARCGHPSTVQAGSHRYNYFSYQRASEAEL